MLNRLWAQHGLYPGIWAKPVGFTLVPGEWSALEETCPDGSSHLYEGGGAPCWCPPGGRGGGDVDVPSITG